MLPLVTNGILKFPVVVSGDKCDKKISIDASVSVLPPSKWNKITFEFNDSSCGFILKIID